MSGTVDVVFLGINDAGMRVYDWLCGRDDVFVHSLLTTVEQLQVIEAVEPDFVVSCGYRHVVPESILDVPSQGCLNLHPAYLPYNRGAHPNVWSIVDGTPAGVTLHYMDASIDTGDIVARRRIVVDFSDTGKTLYGRQEDELVRLFKETWPKVQRGEITRTPQEEGTSHKVRDFEELCDLDPDAEVRVKDFLDRLRALTFSPYDNAEIEIDGNTYHVEVSIREAD